MNTSEQNQLYISDKKFDLIYQEELLSRLIKLEQVRKSKAGNKQEVYRVISIALLIGIGSFALTNSIFAGVLASVALPSVYLFWHENHRISYAQTYKETMIPLLLKHVDDTNLTYTARLSFSPYTLEQSGLIRHRVTNIVASNGLHGTMGSKRVLMAEMRATAHTGHTSQIEKEVFKGLFCKADFDPNEDGWVWIYPEDQMIGDGTLIGDTLASFGLEKFESPTRIRFANQEFESNFRIYSSSPEFAESIVTPKLMEHLLDLRRKSKRVALTLRDGAFHVAVWTKKNYLEPDANLPATDRAMILRKFAELKAMLSIVSALPDS